jgi:ABC-2 type transport system permease protein
MTAASWMARVGTVAVREFRHTALTKAFLLAAVAFPLLGIAAVAVLPLLLPKGPPPLAGTIAIVDPIGDFAASFETAVREPASRGPASPQRGLAETLGPSASLAAIETEAVSDTEAIGGLKQRLREGGLLAVIDLAEAPSGGAVLTVPSAMPARQVVLLEELLRDAAVDAQARAAGEDPARLRELLAPPPVQTLRLADDGSEAPEQVFAKLLVPMGFMMLLWISVLTSGNYLLASTIEEKSNRVMEVLLSAVSPMQLLAGKILGYGLVALVLLVGYGGLALTGLAVAAMLDLVPIGHLLLLLTYFVMAYFMIAAMLAAVGGSVSELRDAQSLVGPVMLVLMLPLLLWMPISENPNGLLATVASFLPPLIPFVMILRTTGSAEPIAAWQIALSIVVGAAATVGMVWAAARVFRVGILMQGKPPTPLELLRWIRRA